MLSACLGFVLATASVLPAQRADSVAVSVCVVDSAGAPVGGADVAVVHGTASVIARGATNTAGRAVFNVNTASRTNQLIVRKIGFQPEYRFFSLDSPASLSFELMLTHSVTTLAAVNVSARRISSERATT